jgi:SAM-dependent methyltransferase
MDPYLSPDSQADEIIDALCTRLEERGGHSAFAGMIADYLEWVPQERPLAAVDLGCGTGVVARRLAGHLAPGSTVVGVDLSERFLERARELDPEAQVRWECAPGDRLPLAAGSQDLVVLHTLLSHVEDPAAILREARRVLRPGGQAVVFEADHGSTVFGFPDPVRGRTLVRQLYGGIVHQPDVCQHLPRLLQAAGLSTTRHRGYVLSEAGRADFWLSSVRSFARLIPSLGLLDPADGEEWVQVQLRAHEENAFFAAAPFYSFAARAKE